MTKTAENLKRSLNQRKKSSFKLCYDYTGEFKQEMENMVKNAKMKESDLSLNTDVQYAEDFKFWVLAAGNDHRLPIVKMFVSGLKPEVFREEIYSRAF